VVSEYPGATLVEKLDGISGKEEYQDCEEDDVDIDQEEDEKVPALGIQIPHGLVPASEKKDQADKKQDHYNGSPPASVIPEPA